MRNLKLKHSILHLSLILFAGIVFLFSISTNAYGQQKCSTEGVALKFTIENSTLRDIVVRSVSKDCKEVGGRNMQPQEKFGGNSFSGIVLRIYEKATNRFIKEIVLEESKLDLKIENCSQNNGEAMTIKIKNNFFIDIEIRQVDSNCMEKPGKTLTPKQLFQADSNIGNAYRIYEKGTNKLLDELVIEKSKTEYNVENCSQAGIPKYVFLRNGTAKTIDIRRVDENCTEQTEAKVVPGRQYEKKTTVNSIYRIYEKDTGKFLEEISIRRVGSGYSIGGTKSDDPVKGFLTTTNTIRAGNNLPTMELDETLSKTCQWFTDFMAKEDKSYPGHTVKEFTKDNAFSKMNTSSQRLISLGWNKADIAHFEVTAFDTVPELDLLGSHFALIWSASNTHDPPFFDKDRVKYNRVGFGYSKAKSGENKYYTCAIFSKK